MEVKLFYKYGTIYREVMHTPNFDLCKIMKDGDTNLMIKQLIQLIKDSIPLALHECPYTVS